MCVDGAHNSAVLCVQVWDEASQSFYYYNVKTGTSTWTKPKVGVACVGAPCVSLNSTHKLRPPPQLLGGKELEKTPRDKVAKAAQKPGDYKKAADFTPDEASRTILGFWRHRMARYRLREMLKSVWTKVRCTASSSSSSMHA